MKKLILLAALLAAGCAAPRDPIVQTQIVEKAVPVPCTKVDLGPRPVLQTKDQISKALSAAPTFDDRLKIVTEQLLLYVGWLPKVEAALTGCTSAPP